MDNLCHTLVGAALGQTGLKRRTALAVPTLLIGANFPDVDVLSLLGGGTTGLGFRRGWTHGILALAILPFVLTGIMWAWHRFVPRRGEASAKPFEPRQILLLAAISIVSHPTLDFLNVYGVRWLMPFSGRWFYGDTLFIVDVWVLVALSIGIWWSQRSGSARPARIALAGVTAYIVVMAGTGVAARSVARQELVASGVPEPGRLMVAPVPLTPLERDVVVEHHNRLWRARFRWYESPHVVLLSSAGGIATSRETAAASLAAASPDGRTYLGWARFPFFEAEPVADGCRVLMGDMRYARAGWAERVITVPLPPGGCS